jgi:hypothetical protein
MIALSWLSQRVTVEPAIEQPQADVRTHICGQARLSVRCGDTSKRAEHQSNETQAGQPEGIQLCRALSGQHLHGRRREQNHPGVPGSVHHGTENERQIAPPQNSAEATYVQGEEGRSSHAARMNRPYE